MSKTLTYLTLACLLVLTSCAGAELALISQQHPPAELSDVPAPASFTARGTAAEATLQGSDFSDQHGTYQESGNGIVTWRGWAVYTAPDPPPGEPYSSLTLYCFEPCTFWVGTADYDAQRWSWHGPYESTQVIIPVNSPVFCVHAYGAHSLDYVTVQSAVLQ